MAMARRRVSARDAKTKISALLNAVERGEQMVITSRGNAVAILGPVKDLEPAQLANARRITSGDIKQGKRNFTGVILHGPYIVTRYGEDVASLQAAPGTLDAIANASPQQHIVKLLEKQVSILEELKILRDEHSEKLNLRVKIDKVIGDRIIFLRKTGDPSAETFAEEYESLKR